LGYPAGRYLEDLGFWDGLIHPEDRERVLDEDERTDRTGEPFSMEYRMIHKDGRTVWIRDEATLVRDDAGEPLYWLGAQLDVTDRKYWEKALREAEERYRTLVEQIPAVTYIDPVDYPDTSLYTSPHIERMLGYTPEEWINEKLWPERLHPEDRERVLAADQRFETGGEERFSEEYRLIAKDGSVVWVHEEAVVVRDEAGRVPVLARGLPRRHRAQGGRAQERGAASEPRRRGLRGHPHQRRGRILEANRALTDMFGYSLAELVGRSALEFVAPEHRDLVRQKIASGAEEPYEVIGVRKDGTRLDLEVRGRTYSYRGRDVRVTAVRDVTERKRAEDRLREAEEALPHPRRADTGRHLRRPCRPCRGSEESLYVSPQVEGMLGYTPRSGWRGGCGGRGSTPTTGSGCSPPTSALRPRASRWTRSTGCWPRTGRRCGCGRRRFWCAARGENRCTCRAS
jgi:PAS domain S-box-containing protein